jgi:hypothetical protein
MHETRESRTDRGVGAGSSELLRTTPVPFHGRHGVLETTLDAWESLSPAGPGVRPLGNVRVGLPVPVSWVASSPCNSPPELDFTGFSSSLASLPLLLKFRRFFLCRYGAHCSAAASTGDWSTLVMREERQTRRSSTELSWCWSGDGILQNIATRHPSLSGYVNPDRSSR